jgi:hypothetical protein
VRAPNADHRDLGPHSLDANVGALPARGRVRPADDLDEEGASTPEFRVLAYKALGVLEADF